MLTPQGLFDCRGETLNCHFLILTTFDGRQLAWYDCAQAQSACLTEEDMNKSFVWEEADDIEKKRT